MKVLIISIVFLLTAQDIFALAVAERSINSLHKEIERDPQQVAPRVKLAMQLAKRGRETANHDFYIRALKVAEDALRINPNHIGASRARIWALLGQHEFSQAKKLADSLNKRAPDDLLTYALMVDANIELGNYEAAERAAQWLIDMRPGGLASLTRAAYLRELFGDLEGSILLLTQAIEQSPGTDAEQHAWLMVHLANLHLQLGRVELAEQVLQRANAAFPNYHYALRQQISVSLAKGEIDQAVEHAENFYRSAPHPENLYVLASLYRLAGETERAMAAFTTFEKEALAESAGWDNANRELSSYFVDVAAKPIDGLKIANAEHSRRQDIFTKDAYAWALQACGETQRAWQVITEVLKIGTKTSQILYHAGIIAHQAGHKEESKTFLRQALAIEPWNSLGPRARGTLALLEGEKLDEHR